MEQTFNDIKYKFFWSGPFSNWHESYFQLNGITYNCGEQYMMHQKALTFGDQDTADKILKETSPREQKQLGRQVKNFNPDIWDSVKYEVVKTGLREKFNQNPDLKRYLLKYKGYQLVEASPLDSIWGIGFAEDKAIQNINDWGQNLLGKILTELASEN
jgi:ribA/ribD-fused uncharacterized protein